MRRIKEEDRVRCFRSPLLFKERPRPAPRVCCFSPQASLPAIEWIARWARERLARDGDSRGDERGDGDEAEGDAAATAPEDGATAPEHGAATAATATATAPALTAAADEAAVAADSAAVAAVLKSRPFGADSSWRGGDRDSDGKPTKPTTIFSELDGTDESDIGDEEER